MHTNTNTKDSENKPALLFLLSINQKRHVVAVAIDGSGNDRKEGDTRGGGEDLATFYCK